MESEFIPEADVRLHHSKRLVDAAESVVAPKKKTVYMKTDGKNSSTNRWSADTRSAAKTDTSNLPQIIATNDDTRPIRRP